MLWHCVLVEREMDFSVAARWMVACSGFLLLISNALVNGASSTGTLASEKINGLRIMNN